MVIEQDLPFVRGLKLKGVIAYDLKPIHKKIWKTPMPYYTVDMSSGSPKYVQAGSDGPENLHILRIILKIKVSPCKDKFNIIILLVNTKWEG